MKIKQLVLAFLLLFGAMSISAQTSVGMSKQELYKAEVREKLQLDWSMPDYTTNKIDANVMGPRLASILTRINDLYAQPTNLSALSVIQSSLVEGLTYGHVKTMKLDKVTKKGNEIIICFNTILEPNNLNLKKSQIVFKFIDGVSEDMTMNDFFSNICRYIKE